MALFAVLLSFFSFCSKGAPDRYAKTESFDVNKIIDSISENKVLASVFLFKKDSLYKDLVVKVNNDSIYVPVIKYIIDRIDSDSPEFFDDFENEYLFRIPLKYLKKIKINNYTLVVADFSCSYVRKLGYFVVNKKNEVVDHLYSLTYREIIDNRKVYDRNHDGNDELVEVRHYIHQMFETYTDVVYSIANDSIKLIFSVTTDEINCATVDDHNRGWFLSRKYTKKGNETYLITETEGYCDCDHYKPVKTVKRKQYQMNIQELLNEYGAQYKGWRKEIRDIRL